MVTVTALEDEGFEVIETEHAEAALGVLQNHAARVNVLFTDIQMPGTMDGLALAHHTAKNWPKIALLLTSGVPARVSRISPKNASFWPNRISTTTSFVIFASLRLPRNVLAREPRMEDAAR